MLRRLRWAALLAPVLTSVGCGSQSRASHAPVTWPSRRTPLSSTLGWFDAINAHNRRKLLSYVAHDAWDQMGWARASASWSTFTQLHCRPISLPASTRIDVFVNCTFNESASPTEGNPDSFWNVELRPAHAGWLIVSYGQG